MATPNPPTAPTSAPSTQKHNRQISGLTPSFQSGGFSPLPNVAKLSQGNATDSPSSSPAMAFSNLKSGMTPMNLSSPGMGFGPGTPQPGIATLAGFNIGTPQPGGGTAFQIGTPQPGNATLALPNSQTPLAPFDTPTLLEAAAATMPLQESPSGLGLNTTARNHEAEAREIVALLRANGGERIGPKSIERVARQLDLDFHTNGEGREKKLEIGGSSFVLGLQLDGDLVKDVTIAIEENDEAVSRIESIREVLKRDVVFEDAMAKIEKSMSSFAEHLAWLSRMDKLSNKEDEEFPCYAAIDNLYRALRTIYEEGCRHNSPSTVGLRQGGHPSMHAGDHLGPVIAYWRDRHNLPPSRRHRRANPYSIRLDLEEHSSQTFRSVQASQPWLGDPPFLPSTTDTQNGDPPPSHANWQTPDRPEEDVFAMALDSSTGAPRPASSPNLRFVAVFDPPVILPHSIVGGLVQHLGLSAESDPFFFRSSEAWDVTMQRPETEELAQLWRTRVCRTKLCVCRPGGGEEAPFELLWSAGYNSAGFKLERVPFSHPRVVGEMLPLLRQWALYRALVASLLHLPSSTPEPDLVAPPSPSPTGSDLDPTSSPSASPSPPPELILTNHPPTPPKSDAETSPPARHKSGNTPHRAIEVHLTAQSPLVLPPGSALPPDSVLALTLFSPVVTLVIPLPSPKSRPVSVQLQIVVGWNGVVEARLFDGAGREVQQVEALGATAEMIRDAVEGEDLGVLLCAVREMARRGVGKKR